MDIDEAIIEICRAMGAERRRADKLEQRLKETEEKLEQLVNELKFHGVGYKGVGRE